MTPEFEYYLDKLAEVSVKTGLNLQPGQRLLIGAPLLDSLTPVEAAPLVRLIAAHAYQAGARLVDVLWGDDPLKAIRLKHAPRDSFNEYPDWQVQTAVDYIRRQDALIGIFAHNPDLFQNFDADLLGKLDQINASHTLPIMEYITTNATNWLMIPAVVPGWAAKVFPDTPPEEQDARLWDALFEVCRVKTADPVADWQAHIRGMGKRGDYLTRKQYAALHYTGPGTDLTVGLPARHLWKSANMTSAAGFPFTANIPTEEVFTLPRRDRVDGLVSATKPLSFGGGLVENFSLTFAEGRVVEVRADKGRENLEILLDTDEGARRLGEVSLVPHSSPISRSGLTFYNILIDENASSHLAFGHAYKFNINQGESLSDADFAAAGGNISSIHIDFMVGSCAIDVDGITAGGEREPVMRAGEWAFDA